MVSRFTHLFVRRAAPLEHTAMPFGVPRTSRVLNSVAGGRRRHGKWVNHVELID